MRRICTIAAFAVLLAAPGMANLLTNGSFDNLSNFVASPIPAFEGGDALFVGSTAMTGWTVVDNNGLTANTNQSIAWLLNGAFGLSTPDNGVAFLNLTGYYQTTQNPNNLPGQWAGVQQIVDLPAGAYALSFELGTANLIPSMKVLCRSLCPLAVLIRSSPTWPKAGVGNWRPMVLPCPPRDLQPST